VEEITWKTCAWTVQHYQYFLIVTQTRYTNFSNLFCE